MLLKLSSMDTSSFVVLFCMKTQLMCYLVLVLRYFFFALKSRVYFFKHQRYIGAGSGIQQAPMSVFQPTMYSSPMQQGPPRIQPIHPHIPMSYQSMTAQPSNQVGSQLLYNVHFYMIVMCS